MPEDEREGTREDERRSKKRGGGPSFDSPPMAEAQDDRPPRKRGGGPKTEAGKAVVRLNPIKHGVLAQEPVLSEPPGRRRAGDTAGGASGALGAAAGWRGIRRTSKHPQRRCSILEFLRNPTTQNYQTNLMCQVTQSASLSISPLDLA